MTIAFQKLGKLKKLKELLFEEQKRNIRNVEVEVNA
jgi:hypothetical protein